MNNELLFNNQQSIAIKSSLDPLLIVAGAGTGKTHTLVGRLLYLLNKNKEPQSICVITFTNKAAKEIKHRVTKKIGHFRNINNKPEIFPSNYPFIGTFHSLGAKILRNEAPLFGRNKNYIIFDNNDSWSLIKKIAKKLSAEKKVLPS